MTEEIREVRVAAGRGLIAGFRAALDELTSAGMPDIAEVTVERNVLFSSVVLVARYSETPCYYHDCSRAAVKSSDDIMTCEIHTTEDVIAQEEATEATA